MFYDDEEFENELDEYGEDEEMAPEEESFPVDEGQNKSSQNKNSNATKDTLSALKQKSGQGSKNDAAKLNNALASGKAKANNPAANANSKVNNGEEDLENEENNSDDEGSLKKKAEDAAKAGASEVAKKAASTFLQTKGVPKAAADKISETVVDSEAGQKVLDEAVKKFKDAKKKMIMQIVSAVMPYVITLFMVAFLIASIMVAFSTIVEKVEGAIIQISTGVEKFLNFASGNGWNTEEEEFFLTLQEQYEFSLKFSDSGIDIPLLASTIHYNHLTDVTVYEENVEMESTEGMGEDIESEGMFDNFIESEQTKKFYYVANDKLGSLTDFRLGHRRLIGHMVDINVVWGKYKFKDALASWKDFFTFIGVSVEDTAIETLLSSLNVFSIIQTLRTAAAYDSSQFTNGDSYLGYYARNVMYESEEILQMIKDFFGDNGEKIDTSSASSDTSELTAKKEKGIWPAPNYVLTYNEDKYFDYLVNVYIPGTFYSDGSGSELEYERIAKEMFDQREAFYHLVMDESIQTSIKTNNEITVNIRDCSGKVSVENVSLKDYLSGVLYAEGGLYNSEEYLKAQAIASKNYLYAVNGVNESNMIKNLSISNCSTAQLYCSISQGCHALSDGSLVPGPDESGNYYLEPLTLTDQKSKLSKIIDETYQIFIVDETGNIVKTDFVSACTGDICKDKTNIMDKSVAITMGRDGNDYQTILSHFYTGTIKSIELNKYSYVLDSMYSSITSRFGYRNHPTLFCCKMHSGIDLGAPQEAGIYSYADGVVVTNTYDASYGFYTIIGHGEATGGVYEYYTLYAHQVRQGLVFTGDSVKAGEIIGNVGSTGRSTGPHLHFEVYKYVNGAKTNMDPYDYVGTLGATYGTSQEAYSSLNACLNAGHKSCG